MTNNNLFLGGIYKTEFDERPFRIIGLDPFEVFYDCLWSDNSWTFSGNFRSKTIFYRMQADLFYAKSVLIEKKELNETEYAYFRPDLPMRFGRTKEVNWNEITAEDLNKIKDKFGGKVIGTNKIILVPYGPKGAYQKGVKIESEAPLTELEVINNAVQIQSSVNDQQSNGIGFYRLGFEKGLPRYSIGEYFDRAGIMKE